MPTVATHPNHVWTYDFLEDRTADGRKLRFLTVIDEFSRECLAIQVRRSFPARAVLAVLKQLFAEHGAPESLGCRSARDHARARWVAALAAPSALRSRRETEEEALLTRPWVCHGSVRGASDGSSCGPAGQLGRSLRARTT